MKLSSRKFLHKKFYNIIVYLYTICIQVHNCNDSKHEIEKMFIYIASVLKNIIGINLIKEM